MLNSAIRGFRRILLKTCMIDSLTRQTWRRGLKNGITRHFNEREEMKHGKQDEIELGRMAVPRASEFIQELYCVLDHLEEAYTVAKENEWTGAQRLNLARLRGCLMI